MTGFQGADADGFDVTPTSARRTPTSARHTPDANPTAGTRPFPPGSLRTHTLTQFSYQPSCNRRY